MRQSKRLRRPSHATVIAYLALFLALGGTAIAASQLGKNTVGTKQLKKNAVTAVKIKNGAVTKEKLAAGVIPAAQPSPAIPSIVPLAERANSLPPNEPWHEVGTPGEPPFESEWKNGKPELLDETIGFYRDHEGTVHLKGTAVGGSGSIMFHLPPGFRPAASKSVVEVGICQCGTESFGFVSVVGTNPTPGLSGSVQVPLGSMSISLDGVTFRAES